MSNANILNVNMVNVRFYDDDDDDKQTTLLSMTG